MSSNTSSLPEPASTATRSQLAATIRAAGEPLRALVAELEPADVPLCWAPEVMAAFLEVQRIAESGRVLMTARAAEAGEWQRKRFPSPADWLAAQQGTTVGKARAELELSGQLDDLDATADAVRAGLLSPEQASAVADAATVNPDAEDDLLERAKRDSLRRTRLEAERAKAAARSEEEKAERARRVRAERDVRFWYSNGAGNLSVRGPVTDLKELEQRLQLEVDKAFRTSTAPERRGTRGNHAFDALMKLGHGVESTTKPPVTRLTLVRVDLGALLRGSVEPGEVCEIGGVSVSVAELRRTLGESITQLVLTNGEAVVDVVNLHRKPSVAQKVAKLFAGATCSVERCDRTARLQFDHRADWARIKVTELENLDILCDHDHDRKTRLNHQLIEGTGRRPMVPPDDPRHPEYARRPAPTASPATRPESERTPPMHEAPAPASGEPGRAPVSADLLARIARIKRKEAEFQARLAGQEPLFDTG